MIRGKQLLGLALAVSSASLASADFINGVVWSVPASTASSTPTLGHTPGPNATELATFTANGINFDGDAPGNDNIGGFLNFNGTAGNIIYMNGATADSALNNTLWEFTGTSFFTNGQNFNVMHDDGVNMYVGRVPALLAGEPTDPILNSYTYNGDTGEFDFDFIYTECCAGSAEFRTNLIPNGPSTPEPGVAFLVMGGGLCLLAAERIRRRIAKRMSSRQAPTITSV